MVPTWQCAVGSTRRADCGIRAVRELLESSGAVIHSNPFILASDSVTSHIDRMYEPYWDSRSSLLSYRVVLLDLLGGAAFWTD